MADVLGCGLKLAGLSLSLLCANWITNLFKDFLEIKWSIEEVRSKTGAIEIDKCSINSA